MIERKRGWARMNQIRAEQADQRRQLADELVGGLGREPTALDKINAANIAALHVKATWQEQMGKDSTETRQRLNQALRAAGIKPDKPVPAPRKTFVQRLEEEQAARHEAEAVL